jgi:DNA-binding MarR family transcriptional regulator
VTADPALSYVLEAQVGFRLRRAHQRATEVFAATMAGFETTPVQFAALCKLHDLDIPTSQNALGRLIGVHQATLSGMMRRLAARGLVSQRPDPADARLVLLELTARGREEVVAMKRLGEEVSRRTLAPLSAEEAESFCRLLARLA